MTKHTRTAMNKKVRILLRDGSELSGRFKTRTRNGYVVLDTGRVHKGLILSFIIMKGGRSRPGE